MARNKNPRAHRLMHRSSMCVAAHGAGVHHRKSQSFLLSLEKRGARAKSSKTNRSIYQHIQKKPKKQQCTQGCNVGSKTSAKSNNHICNAVSLYRGQIKDNRFWNITGLYSINNITVELQLHFRGVLGNHRFSCSRVRDIIVNKTQIQL